MSGVGVEEDEIKLLPGFRFHPSDEELITHYLCKKVQDSRFCAIAMGEADLNKSEPWELPYQAKIGEKEWYFFVLRDKKYPTGLRTNRATVAGYWKATGKDKEIYRGKSLVGMKKTLVFYRGRAPKGEKTNWVMHEYRLEGKLSLQNLPQSAKTEWVICRVFEKTPGGKKIHISGMVKMSPFATEFDQLGLPPLTDSLPSSVKTPESLYVSCFSNQAIFQTNQEETLNSTNPYNNFARIAPSNSYYSNAQIALNSNPTSQYQTSYAVHDQTMMRALLENNNGTSSSTSYMRQHFKTEREMITASQETGLTTDMNNETSSVMSNLDMGRRRFDVQEDPSSSILPFDPDCIWNYNY